MQHEIKKISTTDILVGVLLIGVLAAVAMVNISRRPPLTPDAIARNDYEKVKSELLRAAARPDFPNRIYINRLQGPAGLPGPLAHVQLQPGVQATVLHTAARSERTPGDLTRIEVLHADGSQVYRYAASIKGTTEDVQTRQP